MIDLARSADFALGPIAVRPSSRELVGAAGAVMVEPKVMRVLVALSQAEGRVVPRDDLVNSCWDGRIVGDDAVNRVIGKLRRVAEEVAGGAFRIETVARTGHRLICEQQKIPEAVAKAHPAAHRRRIRLPVMGAAVLLVVCTFAWFYADRPKPAAAVVHQGLPAAVTDLETRGLASMFENAPDRTAEGVDYLRQATVLAPRAAPVWGSLAMSYVLSLGWAPPEERAAVVARVRSAANRALGLDPREARSAAALVSVQPTFGQWSAKDAALGAAGSRAYPDFGPLAYQRVQFLMATGQNRAALAAMRPIIATSPLVPWVRAAYIDLVAANGRLEDADRAAEEAGRIWPRDRLIWFTRFDLAMFNGQPEKALALAADRSGWPKQTSADEIELAVKTAKALQRRGDDTARLLQTLVTFAPHGQAEAERAIRAAAALGRPDLALAVARSLLTHRLLANPRRTVIPYIGLPANTEVPTATLFLSPAISLAPQPGFLDLMRDVGLVAYWHHARPPDFCFDEPLRTLCRRAGV
ncbi:winged helix-turn-helix domain-containing protein [Polymorphobacter sp. PAMC 29334]|nr:winged helix-turn-helix domain-containing protein [Polymorphobacter sp. PAMC 29334]